jgi:hypothetical protein
MFTKITIAVAIILGTASASLAATKKSTNSAHDVYVNGEYVGSDPDAFIRNQLRRDPPGRGD